MDTDRTPSLNTALRTAAWVVGIFALLFVAAAFLSVCVASRLAPLDHPVAQYMMDKGPHKVMRRVLMVLALPLVPLFLRAGKWEGWSDCGFGDVHRTGVLRDVLVGGALGCLTIGTMVLLSSVSGLREAQAGVAGREILAAAAMYGIAAILIGVFEETLARGILFRLLARMWTWVPAALISSLLFSYVHFLKPSRDAFDAVGGVWRQTGAVLLSTFTAPGRTPDIAFRFVNLTLMGIVLCVFVVQTRTIWMAAGTHAAWVWIKRINGLATDRVEGVEAGLWLGARSDALDSLLTSFMLLGLAVGGWIWIRPRSEDRRRKLRVPR